MDDILKEADGIIQIIAKDPLMSDVSDLIDLHGTSSPSTARGVEFLSRLEANGEMGLFVYRMDGSRIDIVVPFNGVVRDIKTAFQMVMTEALTTREISRRRHFHWRYTWKHYTLRFNNKLLANEEETLAEAGLASGSIVYLVRKPKTRRSRRMRKRRVD